MGGPPNNSARRIVAKERRMYVMWLKRGGYSYARIADEVIRACVTGTMKDGYDGPKLNESHLIKNYNNAKAYKDVRETMKQYSEQVNPDTEHIRNEMADQLEEMLSIAMEKARSGDMYGVQVALQAIQTKAKLIGANKPERKEVSGPEGGGIPISVIRTMRERAAKPDED